MITFIQIVAIFLSGLAALASFLFFFRLKWPAPFFWFSKIYVSALSWIISGVGIVCCAVGLLTGSVLIDVLGLYVAAIYFIHFIKVTRPPDPSANFEKAFGSDWKNRISLEQTLKFLSARTILKLPDVTSPRFEQNIPFAIIPGTGRKLLCDVWQPAENINHSGLAFIFLHGSAFYFLDKDCGTRPFFRYLAAQGHVIMDVAYRLSPETDVMGMVQDVNRAIAWMKENASRYQINPGNIVVGGGSAGGHLAMLAAYTFGKKDFSPPDLVEKDLSVRAVISLYGSSDMEAIYYHTNQHLTMRGIPGQPKKKVPTKMPAWIKKKMGADFHRLGMDKGFANAGAIPPLMGGYPDECPQNYKRFTVATHIHPGCPPTLLIHGKHDIMAPVKSTIELYERLTRAGVAAILHLIPQTDHAFDMPFPKISPSVHNVIYDVERFLALHADVHETEYDEISVLAVQERELSLI